MKGNNIHPTAILEGDVQLGDGNVIGPFCLIQGPVIMGDDNLFTSHVSIGAPGADTREPRYDASRSHVRLGSRNTIREFSSVHKPYHESVTSLGDEVFLMQSVQVSHDSQIGDGAVLTPMVSLAGLTRIQAHANLALNASVNQFVVVGAYSIVASGSNARTHVRPFTRAIPGKPASVNTYAIKRFGFGHLSAEIDAYVGDGARPESAELIAIVEAFDLACTERAESRALI